MTSLRWPFILAFALVTLFVLAACGETQDDQPAETPTVAAQSSPTQQAERTGFNGTRNCIVEIVKDPGGNAGAIGLPETPEMLTLTLSEGDPIDVGNLGIEIFINGDPPWINLTGHLREDGVLAAAGMGDVGGFQDIDASFDGFFAEKDQFLGVSARFNGELTVGLAGGIPQGQPILYQLACISATPESSP